MSKAERRRAYARKKMLIVGLPVLLVGAATMTYRHPQPTLAGTIARFLSWLIGYGIVYVPLQYYAFLKAWDKHYPNLIE
jgi:hypothetical protein